MMKRLFVFGSVIALLAPWGGSAHAATCTGGAVQAGDVLLREVITFTQDESVAMNDLHWKEHNRECWVYLHKWEITVDQFPNISCTGSLLPGGVNCPGDQPGKYAVDVDASGFVVPVAGFVTANVNMWYSQHNALYHSDQRWTLNTNPFPTAPDCGWSVSGGVDVGGNVTRHTITLWNNSSVEVRFLGFDVAASTTQIATLEHALPIFVGGYVPQDFTVAAGGHVDIVFDALNSAVGTYIYLTYSVDRAPYSAPNDLRTTAEHYVVATSIPTLSQWGMVAVLALLLGTGAWIIHRRRAIAGA